MFIKISVLLHSVKSGVRREAFVDDQVWTRCRCPKVGFTSSSYSFKKDYVQRSERDTVIGGEGEIES